MSPLYCFTVGEVQPPNALKSEKLGLSLLMGGDKRGDTDKNNGEGKQGVGRVSVAVCGQVSGIMNVEQEAIKKAHFFFNGSNSREEAWLIAHLPLVFHLYVPVVVAFFLLVVVVCIPQIVEPGFVAVCCGLCVGKG